MREGERTKLGFIKNKKDGERTKLGFIKTKETESERNLVLSKLERRKENETWFYQN